MKTKPATRARTASSASKTKSRKIAPQKKQTLPKNSRELSKFKLMRLGADEKLAGKLVQKGIQSLRQFASIPASALRLQLDGRLSATEERLLIDLQSRARMVTVKAGDQAVMQAMSTGPSTLWTPGSSSGKNPKTDDYCDCGCCDNVFSLKAYAFSLLDLLTHFWNITPDDVEALLSRSLDSFTAYNASKGGAFEMTLDCDAINEPLPQVLIAVEALEVHLFRLGKPLPVTANTWKTIFVDGLMRLISPPTVLVGFDRNKKLTIADVEAASIDFIDFPDVLAEWKTKLNLLILNLAGINEAVALLSSYGEAWTGRVVGSFVESSDANASPEVVEATQRFEKNRDDTLRRWLIAYRTALLNVLTTQSAIGTYQSKVQTLEASLFISLDEGECRTTTRLKQLVVSLQQIVENIRSGEIAFIKRKDLSDGLVARLKAAKDVVLSESAWQQFRDYETWLGYMYGVIFPENVMPIGVPEMVVDGGEKISFPKPNPLSMASAKKAYLDTLLEISTVPLMFMAVNELLLPEDQLLDWPEQPTEASRKQIEELEDRMVSLNMSLQDWVSLVDKYVDERAANYGLYGPIRIPSQRRQLLQILKLAHAFHLKGDFASAHDWYRCAYDPFRGFVHPAVNQSEGDISDPTGEADVTFDSPFDPVAIAFRRPGTWLRYVILAMVRNLVDKADDEFARGAQYYDRARKDYELARQLLGLNPSFDPLGGTQVIMEIRTQLIDAIGGTFVDKVIDDLRHFRCLLPLRNAKDDIGRVLAGNGSLGSKQKAVLAAVARAIREEVKEHPSHPFGADFQVAIKQSQDLENSIVRQLEPKVRAPERPTTEVKAMSDMYAVAPTAGSQASMVLGPPLYLSSLVPLLPLDVIAAAFCVPLNPVVTLLQQHITVQLKKRELCLDILCEPEAVEVHGCGSDDTATQIISRPTESFTPTKIQLAFNVDQPRFRYDFLVEKARQYVDAAQRLGSLLLQVVQNKDNEDFQELRAQQAIDVATATLSLRELGINEATIGSKIAVLQEERAEVQLNFWGARAGEEKQNVLDTLSGTEAAGLAFGATAALLHTSAGVQAALSASAVADTGSGAVNAFAAAAGQASQVAFTMASFDRRFEEWKNQFELAEVDADIAARQVALARNRLTMASQESEIARLQQAHASEELRFLQTKVTSGLFYDWMKQVLSRDYRTLMHVASNVAHMAQRALEFERQKPVTLIAGDYWDIDSDLAATAALSGEQRSLGILGAERLLADLTELDAFKVSTERPLQNLHKNISFASYMPTEFVALRQTGTITFNTLLDWFDDGARGEYLRLIKCVKITVLATVPPLSGIHARLHNTGESTAVVTEDGGQNFVKKRASRTFGETVILDSPFNASGRFVLNYQDAMLLPFEGLGVETQWTFELPRDCNRFNFDSIADIVMTIEYTADFSKELLQSQIDAQSEREVYEDVAIPLRLAYPDLWYHFKNQRPFAGVPAPFEFKFTARRSLFPPNLQDGMIVDNLTLLFSGLILRTPPPDPAPAPPPRAGDEQTLPTFISVIKAGDSVSGSSMTSLFCDDSSLLLSTRPNRPDGPSDPVPPPLFDSAIGPIGPDGEVWSLKFTSDVFSSADAAQGSFADRISDILLVITVKGFRR